MKHPLILIALMCLIGETSAQDTTFTLQTDIGTERGAIAITQSHIGIWIRTDVDSTYEVQPRDMWAYVKALPSNPADSTMWFPHTLAMLVDEERQDGVNLDSLFVPAFASDEVVAVRDSLLNSLIAARDEIADLEHDNQTLSTNNENLRARMERAENESAAKDTLLTERDAEIDSLQSYIVRLESEVDTVVAVINADSLRTEAVRALGFNRASETQLIKVIDIIDDL